eukprot:600552-Pyramimonas_sp.AAC.1
MDDEREINFSEAITGAKAPGLVKNPAGPSTVSPKVPLVPILRLNDDGAVAVSEVTAPPLQKYIPSERHSSPSVHAVTKDRMAESGYASSRADPIRRTFCGSASQNGLSSAWLTTEP